MNLTRTPGRLSRAVGWLKNTFSQGALVLVYHAVARVGSDPWSLNVTPDNFAEHLDVLRRYGRPMRLQQLLQAQCDGTRLPRSVAVTFDDGYANNLYNAKPLLERSDIPATVYLSTGYIGHAREFWWDELERLLLQPGVLPEALCLGLKGGTYRWELGEATHYSEDAFRRHLGWRAWQAAPTPRHDLYRSLWELLHALPAAERLEVLDELLQWAGSEADSRLTHRPLSHPEVFALKQGELIEVGAHTVTHPALSALPVAAQWEEIRQSKRQLEEIMGAPVTSFAYPYGRQSDYTSETVALVREAGFACACSNFAGIVQRATNRYEIPRVQVQDWDGEKFARRLSQWFRG